MDALPTLILRSGLLKKVFVVKTYFLYSLKFDVCLCSHRAHVPFL